MLDLRKLMRVMACLFHVFVTVNSENQFQNTHSYVFYFQEISFVFGWRILKFWKTENTRIKNNYTIFIVYQKKLPF